VFLFDNIIRQFEQFSHNVHGSVCTGQCLYIRTCTIKCARTQCACTHDTNLDYLSGILCSHYATPTLPLRHHYPTTTLLKNETKIFFDLQKSVSRLRAQIIHSLLPKNHLPKWGGGHHPNCSKNLKGGGPSPNSSSSKYATDYTLINIES